MPVSLSGTVYEWVDAPADTDGEVYVDMAAPTDRIIEPVASASVPFLYYRRGKAVTTSENGTFVGYTGVFPRRGMRDVKIEKEGFHTIKGKFQYKGIKHSFLIFLVRQ